MDNRKDQSVALGEGLEIGLAEFGDPTGRPIFFFHGWPGSRRQGALLDEPGRRLGWRILALDRPGIARSTLQPGWRLQDWSGQVREVAQRLGLGRFSVLGVSGGGPSAAACAIQLGDRIDCAGVCCGAVPYLALGDLGDCLPAYRALLHFYRLSPTGAAALLRLFGVMLGLCPPALFRHLLAWQLPKADREALADPVSFQVVWQSLRESYARGGTPLLADALNIVQDWGLAPTQPASPVLFWHGGQDRNIPLALARPVYGRLFPNGHWRIYPEEGHYSLPLAHGAELLADLSGSLGHPDDRRKSR